MSHKLTIELPDETYDRLSEAAKRSGSSPEEYLVAKARALTMLPKPAGSDEGGLKELLKFAGCIRSSNPRGVDNKAIDEDLAREYESTHEPKVNDPWHTH